MYIYINIGGWGEGASTGKSFRVVRACVRAVWMPCRIRAKKSYVVFPFSLFGPLGFPFSLPCPPSPQPPIQLCWPYRYDFLSDDVYMNFIYTLYKT